MTTPSRRRSSSASAVIRITCAPPLVRNTSPISSGSYSRSGRMGSGPSVLALSTSRSSPPRLRDQFGQRRAVVGIGDVAGDSVHGRTGDGFAKTGGVTCVGDHDPAGVVQCAHEREAESGGATGDEGYGLCGFCCHAPSVKVQVNLRSRGDDGFTRCPVDGRGREAKWVRLVGPALLRGRGTHRGHPDLRRSASVPARRAPTARVHPGRVQHRADAGGGPGGAGPAAGGQGAEQGRLATDHATLARSAEQPDRGTGTTARRPRLLHRLWLPVAAALPDDEPRRLDGDERRRSGRGEPAGTAAPSAPVPDASGPGWPRPPRRPSLPPGRGSGHPSRPVASPRRARRRAASRSGCSGRRCPRH